MRIDSALHAEFLAHLPQHSQTRQASYRVGARCCPMILASLAYVMRSLTWLPPHFLPVYGFQVGSALEMILLSFALAYRITQARREKEIAQEAPLRTLRESERVLEERVKDRTGELHAANVDG